ncbi:MAG TPA: pectate lyase, partial [Vicinamibacteria bacterium]|nr:pectate lyase [Vicinamibacteria bacterium]
ERYRDGTFEYYVNERIRSNDPKGVGPFILASLEKERARVSWSRILEQPAAWYGSGEAERIASDVVLYQRASGGWPKNVDMARELTKAEHAQVAADRSQTDSTIDNGATFTQLRFLARVAEATGTRMYRESFGQGLEFLLRAQYPSGGWPQFFPLRDDYSRHVTFNDGAMVGVLRLLREVAAGTPPFDFVHADERQASARAASRGLEFVLASQVRVGGRLTAWCAQHDAATLEPRPARTYEPVSLGGKESVEIVEYLMDESGPRVANAIEAAVLWLREAQLEGRRVERVPAPDLPEGYDVVVREDPVAPPIWARFYEIGTNRPLFLGRDGVPRASLAEIEAERRTHYSWLGPYAADLLQRRYPAWKAGHCAPGAQLVKPQPRSTALDLTRSRGSLRPDLGPAEADHTR